ncbi:terminase TerL endonuclease subunit [Conchiformibius steedae]|uniref:terminase TerL endonuclease subunit n=1 Tax=Conchiformibius steedae TaxID=153493 RepID=UPI0026ED54A4|nr:terminase TerL endonuclease subunit [Conchiformibius steedae]
MGELTWTTALPDWETRLLKGDSLIAVRPLFPTMANKAVMILAKFVMADVIGKPRFGDVTQQWVYDFVGAIFGSQDPQSFRRLINYFFLLIPKKNGKSTLAAGLMMTAMEMEMELGVRDYAEYLIIAPTKDIADNSFDVAKSIIENDAEMSLYYHVQPHTRTIKNLVSKSTLQVMAADDKTVGGSKATGVLIDELHLFGKMANAEAVLSEATGGMVSRIDGFVIYLSTQSSEPPAGVFRAELQMARDIRDGKIANPHYLPVLYEFPPAMVASKDYENPQNFKLVNPNWGFSVDEKTLLTKYHKAKSSPEPAALPEFFAKHLNVQTGVALRSQDWAGAEFWQQNTVAELADLAVLIEQSEVLTVGIDGGGLDDLLGLAVVGRSRADGVTLLVWTHAWANPSVLARHQEIAPRLQDFATDGTATLTAKYGDDVVELAEFVAQVHQSGKLAVIGVDTYGMKDILNALETAGIAQADYVRGVPQGGQLTGTINETAKMLAKGTLKHGGGGMMAWVVGNAKVVEQGNNIRITKQVSGRGKIDPLMALFDGMYPMLDNPPAPNVGMDTWLGNMVVSGA